MRLRRARRPTLLSGLAVVALAAGTLAAIGVDHAPAARAATTGTPPVVFVAGTSQVHSFSAATLGTQSGTISSGNVDTPAVAVTPSDSAVVALNYNETSGSQLTITSLGPPGYNVGNNTSPTYSVGLPGPAAGLAVSPDGATAYTTVPNDGVGYYIVGVNIAAHTVDEISVSGGNVSIVTSIALSPDGGTLYVGGSSYGSNEPEAIDAVSLNNGIAKSQEISEEGQPTLAVTPNGSSLYAGVGNEVIPFSLPTLTPGTPVTTSDGSTVTALAISPDGHEVYFGTTSATIGYFAVNTVSPQTVSVPNTYITGLAVAAASNELIGTGEAGPSDVSAEPALFSVGLGPNVPGSSNSDVPTSTSANVYRQPTDTDSFEGLAITPDQAPVAALAASPATPTVGKAVTFSAAGSSVRFGSIPADKFHYLWNWSGGSCSPNYSAETLSCTFGAAGKYAVSLTEIDTAGTSTVAYAASPPDLVDFTGQTASRVASSRATAVSIVTVSTAPTTSPPTTHGTPATVPVTTPAASSMPALTVNPGLGPPGFVTEVSGTGFPPDTPLIVTWSAGVGSAQATTSATGTFSVPMLVMPNDLPGPRDAQVATFPSAIAPFLVVPGGLQPGGSSDDLLFDR